MPKEKPIKAKRWKDIHTLEDLIPKLKNDLTVILLYQLMIVCLSVLVLWFVMA